MSDVWGLGEVVLDVEICKWFYLWHKVAIIQSLSPGHNTLTLLNVHLGTVQVLHLEMVFKQYQQEISVQRNTKLLKLCLIRSMR